MPRFPRISIFLIMLLTVCPTGRAAASLDPIPPVFTFQPQSKSVVAGTDVFFGVTYFGVPMPAVQWRKDGVVIPGANADELHLSNVTPADAGAYSAVISSLLGSAISLDAILVVYVPPAITNQPVAQTVASGGSATFSVGVSGNPAPSLQWKKNGSILPGETGTTLSIPKATQGSAGLYSVVATNSAGTISSVAASLVVAYPPLIRTAPVSRMVAAGATGDLTVVAEGNSPLAYQWRRNGVPLADGGRIAGATSPTLSIAAMQVADGGSYDVAVSNAAGSVVSPSAMLATASVSTQIVTQPQSQEVFIGFPFNLGVAATGSGPFAYQWFFNGVALAGATNATYAVAHADMSMTGDYAVWVSNSTGGAVSATATMTIDADLAERYAFTTFAGTPAVGSADGPAGVAQFYFPQGVAVDAAGNVYVADAQNATVRKILPDGTVTTLAGRLRVYGSADGQGANATFGGVQGVAVDSAGNVYAADTFNHTIRKITPAGLVSTFAGVAGEAGNLDGNGAAARFDYPESVAVDLAGNVLVADRNNGLIRKITPAGDVTTLSDGSGSDPGFGLPRGVAVDGAGNVYVADTGHNVIRKITPAGVVSILAGRLNEAGSAFGAGPVARFSMPIDVAVDALGNVYVADYGSSVIAKIAPDGMVTAFAGLHWQPGDVDGVGGDARFNQPGGLAVDGSGRIFVADTWNHKIRLITPDGTVSTYGGPESSAGGDDGVGSAARFNRPQGVALADNGDLYVADTNNHTIRRVTPGGGVTTIAGQTGSAGSADGFDATARFYYPRAVAVDLSGTVYVADSANATIRKITPGGEVTTLAGWPGLSGLADGPGSTAHFIEPQAIAVGRDGMVYVGDKFSGLRRITPAGIVSTVAGPSVVGTVIAVAVNRAGFVTALTGGGMLFTFDPQGSLAGIPVPTGVSRYDGIGLDGAGNLYVADQNLSTVQRFQPGRGSGVSLGGQVYLTGSDDGTGEQARFNRPTGLAVSPSGRLYVADTENNTIRLGLPVLSTAVAPVIVSAPIGVTAFRTQSIRLEVGVIGYPYPHFQWRKDGANLPGATANFLQIDGLQLADAGDYSVVVANTAGSVESIPAMVTVKPEEAPVVTQQPVAWNGPEGSQVLLLVGAGGGPTPTYQWRKNGVDIAGATSAVLILGPATPDSRGRYDVVVKNSAGSVVSSTVEVNVAVARLTALSVRSLAGAGDNTLIAGVVLNGNATKRVILRGVGSTLPALGVNGALSDPQLGLFNGSTLINSNDNWGGQETMAGSFASVGLAPLATDSRDAAMAPALATGVYTAHVSGVGGATGIALFEIYDGEPSNFGSRLSAISVRSHSGPGAEVLIVGFAVAGDASKRLVIRGVGPSLGAGVPARLADPELHLFQGSKQLENNDNWGGGADLVNAFNTVGLAALPPDSKDAAILTVLYPGIYTVQLSGVAGTSGVGLIEVYELP